jgi:hypothetical protein
MAVLRQCLYQDPETTVILHYRNDAEVTLLFTEFGKDFEIVLDRRNAADLKNMIEIYLER